MDRQMSEEKFNLFLEELSERVGGNFEYSELDELRGFVSVITADEVCWEWNIAMDTSGNGSFLVSVDNFEGVLEDGRFSSVESLLDSLPHPRSAHK